jgi:acyl-coenzyme A thioesterase PaaI-like protein
VIGRVVGRGRILKRGSRVAFLTGELYDADDRVLATASGTFLLTPAPDTETPGR